MKKTIQIFICLFSIFFVKDSFSQSGGLAALQPEVVNVTVPAFQYLASDTPMPVLVYKLPQAKDKSPVVIFSHGRPGTLAARAAQKSPVHPNIVRYWHSHGYSVVAAVRPGYGDNSKVDPEDHGVRWDHDPCSGEVNFQKTANAATHAVKAVHKWLTSQEWVKTDRLLLVGQSVGGFTTVNACGQNWSGVIGCINFVGGTGGNPTASPGKSCKPEKVSEIFSQAAKTTNVPSLWLYSANDKYWGEDPPKQWFKSYQESAKAAGQTVTSEFFAAPAVGENGHSMQVNGMNLWVPVVDKWLDQNRF